MRGTNVSTIIHADGPHPYWGQIYGVAVFDMSKFCNVQYTLGLALFKFLCMTTDEL